MSQILLQDGILAEVAAENYISIEFLCSFVFTVLLAPLLSCA